MKRPPSQRRSPPKKRGAKKATSISVHSEKQISAMCTRFQLEGPLLTYRDVCRELNTKYGTSLSLGTVYRMAHDGKMPRDRDTLRKLGLVRTRQPSRQWKKIALMLWSAFLAK